MPLSKHRIALVFATLLIQMAAWSGAPIALAADSVTARAEAQPADEVHVKIRMLANVKAVQAGNPFKIGVELTMDPGWHTYYRECGDAGMPTKIEWKLPPGFSAGALLWQRPNRFDDGGIITYGYADKTLIATQITPPKTLVGNVTLHFGANVKWLSCKEICLPGKGTVSMAIPVGKPDSDNQEAFSGADFNGPVSSLDASSGGGLVQKSRVGQADILTDQLQFEAGEQSESLPLALLLAFAGGVILNFMPCVLPVIAIKILSFIEQSHQERGRVQRLALTFAAGITASFLVLAVTGLIVQAAGQQVGWGFQFQYPGFIIAVSVVVLLFALSLFGLFFVSVGGGTSELNKLANKEGYVGTFFKGVLATVLSTPCTAPFLGSALGFAFTRSKFEVLLIFFTIGLGMSAPYLILSLRPDWIRFIPKPGAWMEKLKESFGFILLATLIWLLNVLGSESGIEAVTWTSGFLVAVAFAAWLIARFTDLSSTQKQKVKVWSLASLVVLTSFYFCVAIRPGIGFIGGDTRVSIPVSTSSSSFGNGIAWEPLSLEKLNEYRNSDKTIFLDFTAQWCLTCKVNEQTFLDSQPVVEKLKALKIVTMRADWTTQDATITRLLHKFNRNGVPLYVIFPAGKPDSPIVLPEVINSDMVIKAIEHAGPSH